MGILLIILVFILTVYPWVIWAVLQFQIDELKEQMKGQQNEH